MDQINIFYELISLFGEKLSYLLSYHDSSALKVYSESSIADAASSVAIHHLFQ